MGRRTYLETKNYMNVWDLICLIAEPMRVVLYILGKIGREPEIRNTNGSEVYLGRQMVSFNDSL